MNGKLVPLLSAEEVQNLSVSRGTLTEKERLVINAHMVHTVNILNALPFPPQLRRVPEYATGHHEKMDGTGYPRGIYAGDMSVPARIMAVADVFEALTAERPYRAPMAPEAALRIMREGAGTHLCPLSLAALEDGLSAAVERAA
jgi:HD-GYP domain-containing protein (c-di-GMP phosphodiesterase class II)